VLGAGYGSVGALYFNLDWGPVFLGAGLTAVGGLLPDLDSDSGVPVRELFTLGAVLMPFLLLSRLAQLGFSVEQTMVILAALYLFIRYVVSNVFKRFTVHRGIYHSLPAMLIAGLLVFHAYHSPDLDLRVYLAVGTMIGFLSHLVLDELCSVDFMGAKITLNKFAGSAVKLFSPSWTATLVAYVLLAGLGWKAYREIMDPRDGFKPFRDRAVRIGLQANPSPAPAVVKEPASL
jgi:LexA-binding, inner membrane-associated putative hydrolase